MNNGKYKNSKATRAAEKVKIYFCTKHELSFYFEVNPENLFSYLEENSSTRTIKIKITIPNAEPRACHLKFQKDFEQCLR
jgi:hypothetical protein